MGGYRDPISGWNSSTVAADFGSQLFAQARWRMATLVIERPQEKSRRSDFELHPLIDKGLPLVGLDARGNPLAIRMANGALHSHILGAAQPPKSASSQKGAPEHSIMLTMTSPFREIPTSTGAAATTCCMRHRHGKDKPCFPAKGLLQFNSFKLPGQSFATWQRRYATWPSMKLAFLRVFHFRSVNDVSSWLSLDVSRAGAWPPSSAAWAAGAGLKRW